MTETRPHCLVVGVGVGTGLACVRRFAAGGYRVSPVEVESALATHPGITQAGAAEVEIKRDTRVIVAFYTGPAELDAAELQAYAGERLARYKQPRAFVHLDAMPIGGNGKLLRRALPAYFKSES